MRRPAVFFDRDNTLIASDGYLGDPAGVTLIGGAADAIARARALGYATVIISNQSGVARGMFTEEAVHAVNNRLDELLAEANPAAIVDRHEFCPFHPEGTVDRYRAESPLRKPAPGMILQAAGKLALDLSRSWVIGDAPRDIEAGKAAGCRTILFHDPSLPASPAAMAGGQVLPDHYVQSLGDAMQIIETAKEPEETVMTEPPQQLPQQPTATFSAVAITPPATPSHSGVVIDVRKLESLTEQILQELRKPNDSTAQPFSFSKMLGGIMQAITLATLVVGYLNRGSAEILQDILLLAIVLQLFTIALLIMGRQR